MEQQQPSESDLLARLAANHLFLNQIEPFRATILALRSRNPDLARSILQTIVAKGGRYDSILFSRNSTPALLTYLCVVELLQFGDPVESVWKFDANALRLRAEFLLYVQIVISRVRNRSSNLGQSDVNVADSESKGDTSAGTENLVGSLGQNDVNAAEVESVSNNELGDAVGTSGKNLDFEVCLGVLNKVLEVGFKRLKPDLIESDTDVGESVVEIEEGEMMCLREVILENGDIFEALCENVAKQVKWNEGRDDELGDSPSVKEESRDEDVEVFKMIQRCVQTVHLDAMKECLKEGDEDGALSYIQFLRFDCGVDEADYRMVLQDLLKRGLSGLAAYGDTWFSTRSKLLSVYEKALSSSSTRLVHMIHSIQEELLSEEIETHKVLNGNQIPPPIARLLNFIAQMTPEASADQTSSFKSAINACMRDMYHYARISGLHVLECVMDVALAAVKREQLEEASNILSLYPQLQPLVAVMGWDLLPGKTDIRRKLLQLLWTSKSQILRLEESSFYGNKSDEVSCVEHLCDFLCYQLDLASFVACVNSGQSWSVKSSLLLSGNANKELENKDSQLDPFVENLVLERLSIHSPLRVLFDVVPDIRFQDAIELFSMQPITSNLAAWKRMKDIELMHMRYAMESAVLALGAMGDSKNNEVKSYQIAVCYLKDLRIHLEAINNIPRKIMMVNIIISLLHMDDLSRDVSSIPPPTKHPDTSDSSGESTEPCTNEEGNTMVVSFTGRLLNILRQNLPSAVTEQDIAIDGNVPTDGRQALEWRISKARSFIEDWEWRLSILQNLLPLSDRQWKWEEASTVLRAAPSKLLNLCMQRAKYDIGEEAVSRFSLPPEDKATLELAEWVDGAFKKASAADAVSRAADGTSAVQELDFSTLRSQLGPLTAV